MFTFNFIAPNGTTTSTYNASKPCIVVNTLQDITEFNNGIKVLSNNGNIAINVDKENLREVIKEITVSDVRGKSVFHTHHFENEVIVKNVAKGIYIVAIECDGFQYSTKVYCH